MTALAYLTEIEDVLTDKTTIPLFIDSVLLTEIHNFQLISARIRYDTYSCTSYSVNKRNEFLNECSKFKNFIESLIFDQIYKFPSNERILYKEYYRAISNKNSLQIHAMNFSFRKYNTTSDCVKAKLSMKNAPVYSNETILGFAKDFLYGTDMQTLYLTKVPEDMFEHFCLHFGLGNSVL